MALASQSAAGLISFTSPVQSLETHFLQRRSDLVIPGISYDAL